jgi:hypothetical protein
MTPCCIYNYLYIQLTSCQQHGKETCLFHRQIKRTTGLSAGSKKLIVHTKTKVKNMSDDKSLYGISEEFQRLEEILNETGGEITEDIESKEAELLAFLEKKVDGCCGYIQKMKDQISNAQEAKKRLDAFMKTKNNQIENFKFYIRRCMDMTGRERFDGELHTIDTTKGRESLVIAEGAVDKLPFEFIKTTSTAMKDKLEAALRAGQKIEGVQIVRAEPNIRIGLKKGAKRKPKTKEVKDANEQSNA